MLFVFCQAAPFVILASRVVFGFVAARPSYSSSRKDAGKPLCVFPMAFPLSRCGCCSAAVPWLCSSFARARLPPWLPTDVMACLCVPGFGCLVSHTRAAAPGVDRAELARVVLPEEDVFQRGNVSSIVQQYILYACAYLPPSVCVCVCVFVKASARCVHVGQEKIESCRFPHACQLRFSRCADAISRPARCRVACLFQLVAQRNSQLLIQHTPSSGRCGL